MGGAQETGNSWMEDEASSLDEKVRGKMAFSPSQGCGAGSTFIFPPGSGSAFNLWIRIQEGKFCCLKQTKIVVIVILCLKIKSIFTSFTVFNSFLSFSTLYKVIFY